MDDSKSEPQSPLDTEFFNGDLNDDDVETQLTIDTDMERNVRVLKCACYAQCKLKECLCSCWKNGVTDMAETLQQSLNYVYSLKCAECMHQLNEHFYCTNDRNGNALLSDAFQKVNDFEDLATKARITEDHDVKQIYRVVANAYETHLKSENSTDPLNFETTFGIPPFEDVTIIDIFENFLSSQYKHVKKELYVKAAQVLRFLITAFDYYLMESPNRYFSLTIDMGNGDVKSTSLSNPSETKASSVPEHVPFSTNTQSIKASGSTKTIHDDEKMDWESSNGDTLLPSREETIPVAATVTDPCSQSTLPALNSCETQLEYRLMFYRWMIYCKLPQIYSTLKPYKIIQVFGKQFLRFNFSIFANKTLQKLTRNKDRLQSNEKEIVFNMLAHVIKFFEMELKNIDTSPIFKTNFLREKHHNITIRDCIANFDQSLLNATSTGAGDKRKLADSSVVSLDGPVSPLTATVTSTSGNSAVNHFTKRRKMSARNRTNASSIYSMITNSLADTNVSELAIAARNPYLAFEKKIEDILKKIDANNSIYGSDKLLKIAAPRDELAKQQEKNRIINVQLLGVALPDDKQHENLNKLLYLQHIFSRQLTEMPKSYIAQVVFDSKHLTLALLKNQQPIAGICFCPFFGQGFTEIVFCAVLDGEQVQGYGSHLMNHLKDLHVQNDIMHLLAFADNKAIGYFEKQGFSKDIRMPASKYKDYIKDYTASVLMHCELAPNITYTEYISVIQRQKAIIEELINEQKNPIRYPGLKEQFASFLSTASSSPDTQFIAYNKIPGLEWLVSDTEASAETKPRRNAASSSLVMSLRKKSSFVNASLCDDDMNVSVSTPSTKSAAVIVTKEFQTQLKQVLNAVKNHDCALPFRKPVDKKEVPDYYDVIKYPMDLQTMTKRLNDGYYVIERLFLADMKRIFTNCRIYNCPDTWVFKYAVTLEKYFQAKWDAMKLAAINSASTAVAAVGAVTMTSSK